MNQNFFIIFIAIIFGFKEQKQPTHNPMFFNMAQEYKEVVEDQGLFEFYGQDTAVVHELHMLSDTSGAPRLFYAAIETPVCAGGKCKLAKIKVYWNLLGNYVGFGMYEKTPLTKNEHDPFTNADYKKLHQLLGDRHSILERREMDDLIDEVPVVGEALKIYKGVDAISGATKKEIKESVVKGGLYSCYTLWHLVHGEVVKDMQQHLKSMYSDTINNYFLKSPYVDYQEYGLKNLKQQDFDDHFEEVIQIFKETSSITRAYILKKIPNDLFVEKRVTNQFYEMFSKVDMNTRTQLIQKMRVAHSDSSQILVEQITDMTKNQLTAYLKYLEEEAVSIDRKVKSYLVKASNYKGYTYNYLIKEFLKNRK